MKKMIRNAILMFSIIVLSGCGGSSDSDSGAGGGTTGCTGAELAGTYLVTVTSDGVSESDTITFVESDFPDGTVESFSGTVDGVKFSIMFNDPCNGFSGTIELPFTSTPATFTGSKI